MRIFINKWFAKFAKYEKINDAKLCEAVRDAEKGLIDADYGGGVIKQRVSRPNEGKSGGYRTIILYHQGDRSFFVYGFSKNDRQNITKSEESEFKRLAKHMLSLTEEDLVKLLKTGALKPVDCHEKSKNI